VVDAAVKVHRELGPGLLETVYEVVLARELERRGLRVERQVPVPIVKDGIERVVNGLAEENLGVLASLRETKISSEPGGPANAAPPHRSPLRRVLPAGLISSNLWAWQRADIPLW
jgi:hypothetical protein